MSYMKEKMIERMNDEEADTRIVEHHLNGFAEDCPNVLLNREDYNILKKKCEKMLAEQRMCSQHIGTIDDCKNQAVMCYQCYLKKIKEFEKAVRNDEKQEVLKEVGEIEIPNNYHGLELEPKKLKHYKFYQEWLEQEKKHGTP